MVDRTYELWIVAYATGDQPVGVDTVLNVFDEAASAFDMPLRGIIAGKNGDRVPMKEGLREWVAHSFNVRSPDDCRSQRPEVGGSVSVGASGREREAAWYFASQWGYDYHARSGPRECSRFCVNVDLINARTSTSVQTFLLRVAKHLLADPRIWYGFIDLAPAEEGRTPGFYGERAWITFARWELFVEQAHWRHFALGTRDRVRGVYWGNILGPDFARRVKDAGYEDTIKWMQESEGSEYAPVTLEDKNTGSMAILLDEDPVAFAKTRDTGLMDMGGLNRSVKTAAAVREAFSRARLL